MKAVNTILASLVVAGVLATGAQAQDTMKVQKPFSIKVGGIFFGDGDTKDAIGNSTVTVGLGYDFLKTRSTNPVIFQGYVDYLAPRSRTMGDGDGGSIRSELDYVFGFGVNARYAFLQQPSIGFIPYGFAGIGFYTGRASVSGNGIDESDTENGFGGKLGLGAELKEGIFGELEYNFIDLGDANLNGFGARIGYRF
ncbi:MAG: hypothetical protein OHK0029_37790 [Armatimonadaceae bacterium]